MEEQRETSIIAASGRPMTRAGWTSLYAFHERDTGDARPEIPYPDWGPVFLDMLGRTGNVLIACRAAGIRQGDVRRQVKGQGDLYGPNAQFCAEMNDALDEAVDLLRNEAWKRALRQSDPLLMFLLKAHDPELYAPQRVAQVEAAQAETASHISDLRARLLSRLAPADTGEVPGADLPVIDVASQEVQT